MVTVLAPSMKPEPDSVNRLSSPGRPLSALSVGTTCSRMPALAAEPGLTTLTLPVVARLGTTTCKRVPSASRASGATLTWPVLPSLSRVLNSTRVSAPKWLPRNSTTCPTLAAACSALAATPLVALPISWLSVAAATPALPRFGSTLYTTPCVEATRRVPSAAKASPEISLALTPWAARSMRRTSAPALVISTIWLPV